jgi:hypothetical protein
MYYVISSKNYVEHLEATKKTKVEAKQFVMCIKGALWESKTIVFIKDKDGKIYEEEY